MRPVSSKQTVIGCFGRLVWQKGFEYLIRSIPAVTAAVENARLVIVGDGPDRKPLEKLTAQINVSDRVRFTGFMEDVLPWMSRVDVVAIPSVKEGFPVVTLEAMAMAKAIVASNIAGIDEQLKDRYSALMVPPRSPSALADAIISLIQDRQLAADLGKKARRTVERKFSMEAAISATKRVYDDLCNPVNTDPIVNQTWSR